jgi:outer membrane protein
MKKIVIAFTCAFLFGVSSLYAQKFGYINSQELLGLMPEVRIADSSLKLFAKSYQDQLDMMGKEYQKKLQDYQAQAKTMSDAMREVKEKELMDLQNRMETTNQSGQDKIQKKKQELYEPILEKADKAIKDVAKANNYDYVFDAGAGSLLYAKESDNILPLVKAKLGIK